MLSRMREEVAGMEAGPCTSDAMAKDLGPMFDQALGVNTVGGNMYLYVHVEVTWSC